VPTFAGWNSSYTGKPIPEEAMREWLECTAARICALRPRRVLEIGCGVGLLLEQLAEHCQAYYASDFSAIAIKRLRQWLATQERLHDVEVREAQATDLAISGDGPVDTIILNSVVQYFLDGEYLMEVLRQALERVNLGGKIFIGDVRNLDLLPLFHNSVQFAKASQDLTVQQLRARIRRGVAQEKELVLAPELFRMLPLRFPSIAHVDIQLKRGRDQNELTAYRYDVVLHIGKPCDTSEPGSGTIKPGNESIYEYSYAGAHSVQRAELDLRRRRPRRLRLVAIPNQRLAHDLKTSRFIDNSDPKKPVGHLRDAIKTQLSDPQIPEGEDPETLWSLGERHGYAVNINWTQNSLTGNFDAEFVDRSPVTATNSTTARRGQQHDPTPELRDMRGLHEQSQAREKWEAREAPEACDTPDTCVDPNSKQIPWHRYTNSPAVTGTPELVAQLREALKQQLPDYMIPSAFILLDHLPLTPNGKLDRTALPPPDFGSDSTSRYEPSQGEVEVALAQIWEDLLRVPRIGRNDNFFELGGHSLVAMRLIAAIAARLNLRIPVVTVFQHPTVQELARVLERAQLIQRLSDVLSASPEDQGDPGMVIP
jgi:2-polyprenyl-3-methyl-5-hydroxy-6-metoxy-1,4-benzoquinol methylase/acyl carrier protein